MVLKMEAKWGKTKSEHDTRRRRNASLKVSGTCCKLEADAGRTAQRDAVSVSLIVQILSGGISARALNSRGFMSFLSASVTHTLNSCHDYTPKNSQGRPPLSPLLVLLQSGV